MKSRRSLLVPGLATRALIIVTVLKFLLIFFSPREGGSIENLSLSPKAK